MTNLSKTVVTRFAPSPTGFLHIGGARTALFNWLFTRAHGGKYLLRIEDTDRKRSTVEAIDAILDGLKWLGLEGDEPPVFQSEQQERHSEVVKELLAKGAAYKCYSSPEELQIMRDTARAEGRPMRYDGRWRDRPDSDAPADIAPVIRLKAPREGETTLHDLVQGRVTVPNSELDDMVLMRSDGTPTYMLSVVVDDFDMGITHVIRGDDHLTNAFRQKQIYDAMGWDAPEFGHIPLIHGADGAKLSKRHGALGVEAYREMGYVPEALRNYLLRLGWGYEDRELITTAEAVELFDISGVGRAAARFDFKKLESFNAHYLRTMPETELVDHVQPFIEGRLERPIEPFEQQKLRNALPGLKERAKTIVELSENALFYFLERPLYVNDKAQDILKADHVRDMLGRAMIALEEVSDWEAEHIQERVTAFAEAEELKLGKVAQPIRAALTGSNVSPSVFDVMEVLGKGESLGRLKDQVDGD